jgi:DNA-binding transcriptional LysR family regulator
MERIPLGDVDLNLLVALDRLLATTSVTAAARELGVTQPAMSRTLQRLRDVLGDPLLVRVGRELVPTERARGLAGPLADALAASRRVFAAPGAFDPRTAQGEIALALGDEAQTAFTDAILAALWAEAPGIDVRIRRLGLETIEHGRRGIIDLALTPDLDALPASAGRVDLSEFVQKRLYDRRFVVVSSPEHARRALTVAEYAAAEHVIVGFDGTGQGFVDDLLAPHGLTRRVAATVTSFTTAAAVVGRTSLIATLPEEVVHVAGVRLVVCAAPVPIPLLPMNLLWHPRRTTDPKHRFVRELVSRAITARVATWTSALGA